MLLKKCIGFALLFAAATYALRLYVNLRRVRGGGPQADPDPHIRPLPTIAIGALGGLLVGITSVGSGSVIMISLVMLYPGLSALRLVGTDLVQAVPLVIAAAISNIALNGLDWHILIPLVIGSTPGSILGSRIAPRVPQSFIRRGIVIVLTMSGLALLDKSGWAPLGAGDDDSTHPVFIALVGVAMVVVLPVVWGLIRRTQGLPMYGSPTVAELEGERPLERGPRHPSVPRTEPVTISPRSRSRSTNCRTSGVDHLGRYVVGLCEIRHYLGLGPVTVDTHPDLGRRALEHVRREVQMIEIDHDHTLRGLDVRRCLGVAPDDLADLGRGRRPGPSPHVVGHAPSLGLCAPADSMMAAVPRRGPHIR